MKSDELAQKVEKIVEKCHSSQVVLLSDAFVDGGTDGGAMMMGARLARAAVNEIRGDSAAPSRYGIWANTVRDHIIEALGKLENSRVDRETLQKLRDAANSMSAFAEVQALLDQGSDG